MTIPNWTEYNARADRANYSWFRFQNDFFSNQKMFGLSDSQIVLYLMLVCEVSKKNRPEVNVSLDFLATIRKTTEARISKDLQELVSRGAVVTANGHQLVDDSLATNRQTDRQTPGGAPSESPHPFATVWNENTIGLPKVADWTPARAKAAASFLKRKTLFDWTEICRRVGESDFLTNKWGKCNFDWAMKPANYTKVLEGNYQNSGPAAAAKATGTTFQETLKPDTDYV